MGFRVWGFRFSQLTPSARRMSKPHTVCCGEFGVWGLGFGVWGLGFEVSGLRAWGSGFGVWHTLNAIEIFRAISFSEGDRITGNRTCNAGRVTCDA